MTLISVVNAYTDHAVKLQTGLLKKYESVLYNYMAPSQIQPISKSHDGEKNGSKHSHPTLPLLVKIFLTWSTNSQTEMFSVAA